MFWGVTILPGRRYSQKVETTYHLSKACLELDDKSPGQKRVSLMLEHNKTQYLLCHLDSEKNIQTNLDLMFSEDENITFYLNGEGVVHLTGYLLDPEDGDDMDDEEEEDESILENFQKLIANKRKITQDETSAKKIKAVGAKSEKVAGENGFGHKGGVVANNEDDDDDDDEEDEDFDVNDDEEDDEEDDEDDEEEDDEEDDEEEEEAAKPANVSVSKQMGKTPETPKAVAQVKNDFKPKNFQQQQQQQQKPKFGGQQNQQNKFGQQNKGQQQQGFGKKFQQNKQGGGFAGHGGGQNRPKGQFTPGSGQKGGKFFNKNKNKRASMN